MAATYNVQVVIPTADNLLANFATNTWHFTTVTEPDLEDVFDALEDFYNDMNTYMSTMVRQTGWVFKAYDIDDPEPRAPVLTRTWDLTSSVTGAPLPPEVSLCLSFQATKVSGTPQARRRGRVYLPFLDTGTMGTDGRPTPTVVTNIASYGADLLAASVASTDWEWIIYSRVAPGIASVADGWVDNEYDTQRRRGRAATSRTTFT